MINMFFFNWSVLVENTHFLQPQKTKAYFENFPPNTA